MDLTDFTDERIDVLDAAGDRTGKTVPKSEAHGAGLWHRCFHCWFLDASAPGGPCLLVQRRASAKDTWPGMLDVSVAGHLSAGETPIEAGTRELREEVGLTVSAERLVPLGERRVDRVIPRGRDREFHTVYLLPDSTPPGDLTLQREEVASVMPVPLDDLKKLLGGGEIAVTEYGHGRRSGSRVSLSDFVAEEGGYLGLVLGAAERYLRGETVSDTFGV